MEILIYGWDWLSLTDTSLCGMLGLSVLVFALIFNIRYGISNPNDKDKKENK